MAAFVPAVDREPAPRVRAPSRGTAAARGALLLGESRARVRAADDPAPRAGLLPLGTRVPWQIGRGAAGAGPSDRVLSVDRDRRRVRWSVQRTRRTARVPGADRVS